jgi:large subunit ribosomal protein L10
MSKPIKDMIIAEYRKRFSDVSGGIVVEMRTLEATANNRMRTAFRQKGVRVTVLKNSLARKAFEGGPLEPLGKALAGSSALIYGDATVVDIAREVVKAAGEIKELKLKAAVLDGEYFDGPAGVDRLSKFPTKDEAIAKVVSIVLAPAGKVVAAAKSPGSKILGIVKEIQERLEKGEAITAKA